MNYNFPTIRNFLRIMVFSHIFNSYVFPEKQQIEVDSSFINAHTRLSQNPNIHAERMQIKHLDRYAEDFTHIFIMLHGAKPR